MSSPIGSSLSVDQILPTTDNAAKILDAQSGMNGEPPCPEKSVFPGPYMDPEAVKTCPGISNVVYRSGKEDKLVSLAHALSPRASSPTRSGESPIGRNLIDVYVFS